MKKFLFILMCCLCLCGCEEKQSSIDHQDNHKEEFNQNKEDKNSSEVNINDYTEIKSYSNELVQKLNSLNNDNLLSFEKAVFERNIFFIEYATESDISFTLRFNKDSEFIGVTITDSFCDGITKSFAQIKAEYLSIASFYESCKVNQTCSNVMHGLEDGDYTIDNITISSTNIGVIKVFSTTDITK